MKLLIILTINQLKLTKHFKPVSIKNKKKIIFTKIKPKVYEKFKKAYKELENFELSRYSN